MMGTSRIRLDDIFMAFVDSRVILKNKNCKLHGRVVTRRQVLYAQNDW